MNLKHKVLTGNPTGDSRCQALTSRALNTSCYFGQSARSIESRCVVNGCKLSKTGSNYKKIFSPIFFSFLRYLWYPMNSKNGMCILEFKTVYEYTISLMFHQKIVSYPCVGLLGKPGDRLTRIWVWCGLLVYICTYITHIHTIYTELHFIRPTEFD